MRKQSIILTTLVALFPLGAAGQTLSLQQCRDMAVEASKDLDQARTKVEMAGYDRKIAFANYLPNISATGAYLHNNRNLSLISDAQSAKLTGLGTAAQGVIDGTFNGISSTAAGMLSGISSQFQQAIMSNPQMAAEYMGSPMWQTFLGMMQNMNLDGMSAPQVAEAFNAIGQEIDDALHLDIQNVYIGALSLQQPLFAGGKIVLSNQMARLAEELARNQYDTRYADIIVATDQSYWQIVSIASKKELAQAYADLLHQLEHDAEISVNEGVATKADQLQIKVKANEADMLLTKATHGLTLAKMLLCKEIGLPLDSQITLEDEKLDWTPEVEELDTVPMEDVWDSRSEIKSLELASEIYDKKAGIARADMLPTAALTANYLVTNPNSFNGFRNGWNGGMFSAGVLVSIPIFHGTEALQKTRKARLEASLYRDQLEDARNLISLQVTQCRQQYAEAAEKLAKTGDNLSAAEENMRTATIGFEEGVIDATTVLAAQTAWVQAGSENIEAAVDLLLAKSNLERAEGKYNTEK